MFIYFAVAPYYYEYQMPYTLSNDVWKSEFFSHTWLKQNNDLNKTMPDLNKTMPDLNKTYWLHSINLFMVYSFYWHPFCYLLEIKEEPTEKKPDVDTSDEEKQWLDALEKGNLDDSGMLRRSKDPKMLTARQVQFLLY